MKKFLSVFLAGCMLIGILASCGGTQNDPGSDSSAVGGETNNGGGTSGAKYLDVLRIGTCNSNLFTSCYDPTSVYAGSVAGNGSIYMIYDVLFYPDPTDEVHEGTSRILESWSWDDTYTRLFLKLKEGITFSNGDPMTCSDILYSIEQMMGHAARKATFENYDLDASRETISADGLSMTLVLKNLNATLYEQASFPILDENYIENVMGGGENIDWFDPSQVVGSGSYRPTELTMGSTASFEKREDYWGLAYGYDDPYLTVNAVNYTDQSTMSIELETGSIDVAIDLSINDFDRLDQVTDDNITTVAACGNSNWNLIFNNKNEYLSDPIVRQAICEAIDTKALTEAVAGSFGTVADSILAEAELGHVSGHSYAYDPDHARELLQSAGYADGDIQLHMVIMQMDPYGAIAVVVQQYLNEIGIGLTYEAMDNATYNSTVGSDTATDLTLSALAGMNPGCDPSTVLSWCLSTSNFACTRKSYDDLIQSAVQTMDREERAQFYGQIQDEFYNNYEAVPLYTLYKGYAYNNEKLKSLTLNSTLLTWIFECEVA